MTFRVYALFQKRKRNKTSEKREKYKEKEKKQLELMVTTRWGYRKAGGMGGKQRQQ